MRLETVCLKEEAESVCVKTGPGVMCVKQETEDGDCIKQEPEDNDCIKQEPEDKDCIKQEPEDKDCIKQEPQAATSALDCLYINHEVKDELVLGPEEWHQPKVASSGPMGPAQPVSSCAEQLNNQIPKSIHCGEITYACEECKSFFITQCGLRKHLQLNHLSPRVVISPMQEYFGCDLHTSRFPTKTRSLKREKREHGVTNLKYSTKTCKKILESHGKSHIMKRNKDILQCTHSVEKCFRCNYCDYKCFWKHNLINHLKIHTGEKPFRCSFCDYKCTQKVSLQHHMEKHTMKPFICSYCDYKTIHKVNLKNHLINHTVPKCFQCAHCDYKSSKNQDIKRHQIICTNKNYYQCDNCDCKFLSKRYLQNHLKKQTWDKLFTCPVCEFECTSNKYLIEHMKKHVDKSFVCHQCDFKTRYKKNLQQHLMTHTRTKPFQRARCDYKCLAKVHNVKKELSCDHCNFTSNHEGAMTNHVKIHTRNDSLTLPSAGSDTPLHVNNKQNMKTYTNKRRLISSCMT